MPAHVARLLVALVVGVTFLSAAPVHAAVPAGAEASDAVDALAERQKERLRALGTLASEAPDGLLPYRRVDLASGLTSLILPGSDTPYTIAGLRGTFPESFEAIAADALLLKDDIVVGAGARLVVSSDDVRELRLLSDPARFVTITSWRGHIVFSGSPLRPLTVTSWDPATATVDRDMADGRAWLHTRRGRMDISWTDTGYLGFATGSLSGVAWEGREEDRTRGDVTGSRFHHHYFGAYTFEAIEMRWVGNTFDHNHGYGFDPHDHSDYFLVERNLAFNNGDHGIIFSRGCRFNVIRNNVSFGNGRHGIVLDDGPDYEEDGTPRDRQGIDSDDNVIENNVVWGNEIGIVLDGGARNQVHDNYVFGNRYGMRFKEEMLGNRVYRNVLANNEEIGIYLYALANNNVVEGNVITGGKVAIEVENSVGNVIVGNEIDGARNAGVRLEGDVAGTTITGNSIAVESSRPIDTRKAIDETVVEVTDNAMTGEAGSSGRASLARRWVFWSALLLAPVVIAPQVGRVKSGLKLVGARVSVPFR